MTSSFMMNSVAGDGVDKNTTAAGQSFTKQILLLVLLIIWGAGTAFCQQEVPALRERVTDTASLLSKTTTNQLEEKLKNYEAHTGNQIAVLIIDGLEGETIESYALEVFNSWCLGRAGEDNGVLLVVAVRDRRVRIEVGYGLEGTLTDLLAGRIIDQIIVPQFKEGHFDQGIAQGVDSIMAILGGDQQAQKHLKVSSRRADRNTSPDFVDYVFCTSMVILVIAFTSIGVVFLRGAGCLFVVSAFILVIVGNLLSGEWVGAIMVVVYMVIIAGAQRYVQRYPWYREHLAVYQKRKREKARLGGRGSSSRSSGGGRSGGGFSGGGGSSGGGGASGSW